MSRNKKVLSKATRELNKTRRVPVPKNIIEDPRGQWAHPGEITRIPSDTITMQGVPYPVMAYPNVGQPQMMYPEQEYYFPGADHVDEYPQMQDGGIISQEEIDAANRAMMKARLAYAQMHGNPAAQRMVVAPDQPYQFDNGMIGTHYMASMDNYAVPQIQGVDGQLVLGDFGPESAEAMRFDNPEDAMYFAENYKQITPDESYRQEEDDYIETELTPEEIEEYQKGGWIVEEIDSKGVEGCPEGHYWTGTECKEVPKNTKVVYSQEELDKLNRIKKEESKLYNEYRARQKYYTTNQPSGSASVLSSFYKDIKSLPKGPGADPIISYGPMDPYADQRYGRESGVGLDEWQKILKKSSVKPIGYKQGWNFAEYYPVYARPKSLNYVLGVEEEPEPVREKEEPIPTLKPTRINQELQKFIYPEDYPDPEITSDTDADIENYVENGPDSTGAEWNDSLKRYIDWDGNSIGFNGIRFRKPGHGGDLIKKGRRHYIPFPSIESRYQAEIEISPEEYAKGGQYQMGGDIVEEIDDVDSPAAPCPYGYIYDPITKNCVPENAYRLQRAVVKDAINVDDAIRENRRYYTGYKFMQDWMNSPMYDKMLKESARSPESYEWLKKMRQQQLQSTPPLQILPQPKDQPNTGGYSWSDTGQIVILPEGFGTRGTHSHEVSHSSDRPVKGKTSRLIPQKDIDYINKNKAKSFKNSREYYNDKKQYDKDFKDYPEYADAVDQNFKDFSTDYVGDPTETRARLNAIRQIAKEAGIYDPFTEGVSPGLYYDKLKRYQFEKGSKAGFDPMKQLQDVYSDEEIIWLLNNMSKTEDNKPELDMAQRGGQYNIGDEVELTEAEVKRLKKLGYIIERV